MAELRRDLWPRYAAIEFLPQRKVGKLSGEIEQNTPRAIRKIRHTEDLREIVDKGGTAKCSDAASLVLFRRFEEHIGGINRAVADQSTRRKESARRRVQIVFRPADRMPRL